MPKRKRGEEDISNSDAVGGLRRSLRDQRAQADGAIGYGRKALFKALKIARGFERQKLGRRQKTASEANSEEDVKRLATEVAALKSLDLAATAEAHLYKSLLKTKSIASSPALPSYVVLETSVAVNARSVAQANVTARLYNSNPVKIAMADIMGTIREALAIKIPNSTEEIRQHKTSFENRDVSHTAVQSVELSEPKTPNPDSHLITHENHDQSGISENNSSDELSTAELEDYGDHSLRLADSATEDDLPEDDGNNTTLARPLARPSTTGLKQSRFSPVQLPSPLGTATKSSNRKKSSQSVKSTTFLPSLTLGGYWSNSDSAASDSDSQAIDIKTRNNRMGQQARRQLWEKKFGHKANHLKKQSRDQGWDSKKGAQGGDERGPGARGRGAKSNRTRGSRHRLHVHGASGANSDPIGVRREKPVKTDKVDGPLHPSWVAAKKMKEGKRAANFEGKKIVFE
ncbi:hypothetical protein MMC18_005753 [Xylographa bjoerkii]|nr:hypothetical protein [Xylographa bjoerkii]